MPIPKPMERAIRAGRFVKGMTFPQRVWALTARIPPGQVATYGDLARKLETTGYRAVGAALHCNPYAPGVPCHRVVGADGHLRGYAHGLDAKRRMLAREGVAMNGMRVDLDRHRAAL